MAAALTGTFGFELDLTKYSEEELAELRPYVAWYRQHGALLRGGDLHRLVDPEPNGLGAAWMITAKDGSEAAVFAVGDALTGSLQKQWAMEQRQREQIIQLSHKLKTPLTIIEGNAELLAEDDGLTAEQKAQVESILQGAEQTRTYLGKIRAEVQTPLRYKRNAEQ